MGNKITYEDYRKEKNEVLVIYFMPSDVMAFEKPNSSLLKFCLCIILLIFSFLAQKFKQPRPCSGSKQVACYCILA